MTERNPHIAEPLRSILNAMTSPYLAAAPRRAFLDFLWPGGDVRLRMSGERSARVFRTIDAAKARARELGGADVVFELGVAKDRRL